ncbi:MAG: hypothetical protein HUU15_07540 [Candidatus Brocadiae bacterium]|nr:hypothetical protein [Candidatus Brocadiia bacterium]
MRVFPILLTVLLAVPASAEERAAAPGDVREFLPQVEKGHWWVASEHREGTPSSEALLFFVVTEVAPARASILLTAASGYSLILTVNRETWALEQIVPACTTWDADEGRFRVAADTPHLVRLERPGLVEFQEYPALDLVWHAFPAEGADSLVLLTESAGARTATETRPLTGTTTLDASGRLVVARATSDGAEFRQVWEKGLPFPRTASWKGGPGRGAATVTLLRYGHSAKDLLAAGAGSSTLHLLSSTSTTLPCYRVEHRNLVAEDAMRRASEVLAPGTVPEAVAIEGTSWWRPGDVLRVQWDIRALPATKDSPAAPPADRKKIPPSGEFLIECAGTWQVAGEDCVALLAWGRDVASWAWEVARPFQHVDADEGLARLLTLANLEEFSNPEYWNLKTNRWDRPAFLRAMRRKAAPVRDRRPTRWLLLVRRDDLTLSALFNFTLDPQRQIQDFTQLAAGLPAGPVGLRQAQPLLRPQDWLLSRALTGIRSVDTGSVLSLSQAEKQFRFELLKGEPCGTKGIRNVEFCRLFSALIERKTDKREALLSLEREDVIKLENGDEAVDLREELRLLEKKGARRSVHVLRATEGPGRRIYQGYDLVFPWWKETFVFDDVEGYVAHLRLVGPSDRPPPKPGKPEKEKPLFVDRPTPSTRSR